MSEHFIALSGCAEPATDEYVKEYILALAERAYRRPLSDAERESLSQVLSEARALAATAEEIAQYGACAVFESPAFVARFGLPRLDTVVIDPAFFPEFDRALVGAMQLEAKAFVQATLWCGDVGDLMTSRRTRVNEKSPTAFTGTTR